MVFVYLRVSPCERVITKQAASASESAHNAPKRRRSLCVCVHMNVNLILIYIPNNDWGYIVHRGCSRSERMLPAIGHFVVWIFPCARSRLLIKFDYFFFLFKRSIYSSLRPLACVCFVVVGITHSHMPVSSFFFPIIFVFHSRGVDAHGGKQPQRCKWLFSIIVVWWHTHKDACYWFFSIYLVIVDRLSIREIIFFILNLIIYKLRWELHTHVQTKTNWYNRTTNDLDVLTQYCTQWLFCICVVHCHTKCTFI